MGGFAVGNFKMIALAFATLLSSNIISGGVSAMPADRLDAAAKQAAAGIENVAWVCGYYGCRWRPDYYGGYYGGGPYSGPRLCAAKQLLLQRLLSAGHDDPGRCLQAVSRLLIDWA
jgi:hypothetical protein